MVFNRGLPCSSSIENGCKQIKIRYTKVDVFDSTEVFLGSWGVYPETMLWTVARAPPSTLPFRLGQPAKAGVWALGRGERPGLQQTKAPGLDVCRDRNKRRLSRAVCPDTCRHQPLILSVTFRSKYYYRPYFYPWGGSSRGIVSNATPGPGLSCGLVADPAPPHRGSHGHPAGPAHQASLSSTLDATPESPQLLPLHLRSFLRVAIPHFPKAGRAVQPADDTDWCPHGWGHAWIGELPSDCCPSEARPFSSSDGPLCQRRSHIWSCCLINIQGMGVEKMNKRKNSPFPQESSILY